jgi:ABC-type transport system involved in multi-copper enzyme maturation permease subunit
MGAIIKRELLDHLQSIQFLVLMLASLILFVGNGTVFVRSFPQETAAFSRRVTETDRQSSTVATELNKRPNALRFIADGGDRYRPSGYTLMPGGGLNPLPVGQINYKMPDVLELDWSFLIRVVFSLYVILLGFHAISGEKELGTLRLVLSNSLSRVELLTAKFIAILMMVMAPLLVGGLVSLTIIVIYQPQALNLANFSRLAVVLPLALFFLAVFALLSLCISSLVPRSSLVLLLLLAIWVILAIIVPNTSGILAERFSRSPSEYQMGRMVGPLIQKQVFDRIKAILRRAEKGEFPSAAQMKQEGDKAYEEGQKDLIRHYENYEAAMKQRAGLARALARLSPTGLFQFALEDIVRAGNSREEDFLRDARNYSRQYDDYILKKSGRLVRTSNFSFVVSSEIKGETVRLESPHPEEYTGDKSDFPRFQESQPSLLRGVQKALWDMAGLLAWVIVLTVLAFTSFLRTDVR